MTPPAMLNPTTMARIILNSLLFLLGCSSSHRHAIDLYKLTLIEEATLVKICAWLTNIVTNMRAIDTPCPGKSGWVKKLRTVAFVGDFRATLSGG